MQIITMLMFEQVAHTLSHCNPWCVHIHVGSKYHQHRHITTSRLATSNSITQQKHNSYLNLLILTVHEPGVQCCKDEGHPLCDSQL